MGDGANQYAVGCWSKDQNSRGFDHPRIGFLWHEYCPICFWGKDIRVFNFWIFVYPFILCQVDKFWDITVFVFFHVK